MEEKTLATITSEYALQKWNENPTDEIPEVAEWFYTYFFKELLIVDHYHSAFYARQRMIKFVSISEKISEEEAQIAVDAKIHDWCEANSIEYKNTTYTRAEARDWHPYLNKFFFFEVPRLNTKKPEVTFQNMHQ